MDNGLLARSVGAQLGSRRAVGQEVWTYKGKPYGFPLEAWTVELYYNSKMMDDLGVTMLAPSSSRGAFLDMVKKAKAKGITPMALGVGDRPYPGAHLMHEALLKKLGIDDYDKLLKGKLAWSDPRVVETLQFVKQLTDAGLLPGHLHHAEARRGAHLLPHQSPAR